MGGAGKPSGLSEPFQKGVRWKTPARVIGAPDKHPRGIRLRPHFKEMPSSGCSAMRGEGSGLPGLGWALGASRAACWEGRPVCCPANA